MPQVSVSVVIPVYNGARWIAGAIRSVAAQSYPLSLIDVVVVDDGSSDDSAAVAEAALGQTEIQSQVIRVTNGGPSRARNVGWRAAKGGWVQFLDSDDMIAAEKIETQIGRGCCGDLLRVAASTPHEWRMGACWWYMVAFAQPGHHGVFVGCAAVYS
jgi:glycosyltransferase involved in cell wall biosynthesis